MESRTTSALLRGLALLLLVSPLWAAEPARMQVVEPYLELHSGPGRGYPATHAVERGREVRLLKRRTDWVKIATPRGYEGWVPVETMRASLAAAELAERTQAQAPAPTLGFASGIFEDDPVIELTATYPLGEQLAAEGRVGHIVGTYSGSMLASLGLRYRFRPGAQLVPQLSLQAGYMHNVPRGTLVDANGSDGGFLGLGAGLEYRLEPELGLTLEARHLRARFDGDDENFNTLTLGVFFRY